MVSLSTRFSGITPAQAELVSHWHAHCDDGLLPTRDRLDPGSFKTHLSAISMIEVGPSGQTKFRLVGSGLRSIIGTEMRGRYLSELDQTRFEMWSLGLARALDEQQPIGGVMTHETESHAWLRLPLRCERRGALVMCHDALIPNVRLGLERGNNSYSSRNIRKTLAA
ncbi:MAG: PAS domain-containing protein [Pseudomonadota bacterium]